MPRSCSDHPIRGYHDGRTFYAFDGEIFTGQINTHVPNDSTALMSNTRAKINNQSKRIRRKRRRRGKRY